MARGCDRRREAAMLSGKLFAAIAVVLAGEGTADAAVTSCADDGGFDTLRHAVVTASSGDIIDLSGLACSPITLTSALFFADDDLTISGPGSGKLTISGNQVDRVFDHIGAGTLTISNVTIANGKVTADRADGGCIYSKGSVTLRNTAVSNCTALGQSYAGGGGILALDTVTAYASVISGNLARAQVGADGVPTALGGGAFATNGVKLYGSTVSGNGAEAASGRAYGGGIATQQLTMKYSTITGNHASAAGAVPNVGAGGGVIMSAGSTIFSSTLDHNVADAGGAILIPASSGDTTAIVLTTISTNTGTLGIGAIDAGDDIAFAGSTVVFNVSGSLVPTAIFAQGAVWAYDTILADNTPVDIDSGSALTINGSNDLIKFPGIDVTVPPLTVSDDPVLGPLAYNGGMTRTHALMPGSPAIDAGSNKANVDNDQRGPPYRRVVGSHADIGAFEYDADHIFGDTFNFGPLFP